MIKHVFCFKKSLLNQKNDFFWLALASSLLQLQSKSVNAEGFSLELCPSDQISCDSLSFCGLNWSAPGIRSTWETPRTEIGNDSFTRLFPWSCFVLQECKTQDCTLVFLVEHHMKRTQTILPAPKMLCTWGMSAFSLYVCQYVLFVFHFCLFITLSLSMCFIIALTFEGLCTFQLCCEVDVLVGVGHVFAPFLVYAYCYSCQWNVPNKCTKCVPIFVRFTSASHIWNWWFYFFLSSHFQKNDVHALVFLNPEALFRVSSNSSYFRLPSFVFYLHFDSRRFLDERTRTAAPSSFLQKAAVRSCSRAPRYPLIHSRKLSLCHCNAPKKF